jgi:hypothetical protein
MFMTSTRNILQYSPVFEIMKAYPLRRGCLLLQVVFLGYSHKGTSIRLINYDTKRVITSSFCHARARKFRVIRSLKRVHTAQKAHGTSRADINLVVLLKDITAVHYTII